MVPLSPAPNTYTPTHGACMLVNHQTLACNLQVPTWPRLFQVVGREPIMPHPWKMFKTQSFVGGQPYCDATDTRNHHIPQYCGAWHRARHTSSSDAQLLNAQLTTANRHKLRGQCGKFQACITPTPNTGSQLHIRPQNSPWCAHTTNRVPRGQAPWLHGTPNQTDGPNHMHATTWPHRALRGAEGSWEEHVSQVHKK